MISLKEFAAVLLQEKIFFLSGVPCSIAKDIINHVEKTKRLRYVHAVREDMALGLASGAYVAGTKSGIIIQNSGLGHIINGLTSFNLIYRIPLLIFITWRGYKGKDAPEHMIMGDRMLALLHSIKIPVYLLQSKRQIENAGQEMVRRQIPVAVIIRDSIVR